MLNGLHHDHSHNQDISVDIGLASTKDIMALATVGVAAIKLVEGLLPMAAKEVETASRSVTDQFMNLAKEPDKVDSMAGVLSKVVMEMQFQDRNSQIMENAVIILRRYRILLQELRENIQVHSADNSKPEVEVMRNAEMILSGIKLGHLRTNFIKELFLEDITKNLLSGEEPDEVSEEPSEDDNTELF